jgi:hypothetical protein
MDTIGSGLAKRKAEKKCFTIKVSKSGRKYITLRGKKLYLKTLMKKANAKRLKKGRKPLKRITGQNIENVLMSVINDVSRVKDKDTREDFLDKIETEAKEAVSKSKKETKGKDKEEKKEINNKIAKDLKDDLKDIKKKVKKRVKIQVVPEMVETRPTSPKLEGKEEDKIRQQLENIQETLIGRLQRELFGQNGGMMMDKDKALNNEEIEKIMKRYRNFYGVYPRDQLYKMLPQVKEKEDGGCVLNLDKAGEPGSHWVALYWNAKGDKPSIEYFDSYARPPPQEIQEDMKKIIQKLNSDKHLKYKENGKLNQHQDTVSCGFIAMKFLMDRFRGIPFKKATGYGIKKSEENAEDMEKRFRYVLL